MRALSMLTILGHAPCCPPEAVPDKMPIKTADPKPADVPPPVALGSSLATLAPDATTHGFTVVARYTGADGKPLGARFVHGKTKFTFDYLQIESAPQGFLWVNSFPTSDKGEPHTQEHLLLGKGNRGRTLGSASAMALTESSAFTDQLRTAYHFHTVAANDVFWPVFADQLDAMLNPDYTDEEIRREVRNFGVDKGDDGALHLEEKGTVYNEMVRAYESPDTMLWRSALRLVYGAKHPLAFDSGGAPEAIRTMTPADIRAFHGAAYHLANMGVIAAFPSTMALPDVLDHVGATLDAAAGRAGKVSLDADLPKPAAAAPATIELVEYPFATPTNAGPMMLIWPATRDLDARDRLALQVFVDAFAGDESTTLYKKLIDSKTRVLDTGANGVGIFHSDDQGEPLMLSLSGVRTDKLDAKTIGEVRALVLAELTALTKLPDGDPALVAFAARVKSRIVDLRRRFAKNLDTPPGFGVRGIGPEWLSLLRAAGRQGGFDKSLVFAHELDALEQLVSQPTNPWRARIATWGLLEVPYGLAAKPSPALRAQLDRDHKQRIADELVRLRGQYQTVDDKATLAKVAADEAAVSRQLDETTRATPLPPLVATPPMTRDDGLIYETDVIGGAKILRAKFDSMASARLSVAFSLKTIDPADHWYLALLPTLLTDVGVIEDGKPVAADEVRERLRKEILELSVQYATSPRTDRVELVVSGAGSNPAETRRALGWMTRILATPDWRIENLPRLRDVVDQSLIALRSRMTNSEEYWVRDPRDAWDRQTQGLRLHVDSFLTMAHDLHRLRWMLRDPRDAKVAKEATTYIAGLATARSLPRAQLVALAAALGGDSGKLDPAFARWSHAKLSAPARALARDAARDLGALLGDLPDGSLAQDWTYL
ncbi:MAG: hypothetical protein NT062_24805, partial [Proteobacteria bacterium]|nr:hypothetical protein [Pseudomonadota bacterium]